jgi:uroporphyrinogen decarboxylase
MMALNFEETDRIPRDLGGMLSTGISCFAYPKLVEALGLPFRRPRIHDTWQMLALPDLDILDALDCDVVTIAQSCMVTNAFEEPGLWKPYDFNGRLEARVLDPDMFEVHEDGTISQPMSALKMPPEAHVFDSEHGGQPLDLSGPTPKPNLDETRATLEAGLFTLEQVDQIALLCQRVRESTDRAVFFNGPGAGIGIAGFGGIAVFPLLCMIEPEHVAAYHEIITEYALKQLEQLLPAIAPNIDIYLSGCDDWGTQNHTFAAPSVFKELFQPYYRQVNDTIHRLAPETKTFIHTCGAIYDIIDDIIDSGFDILNPIQWPAGSEHYDAWKDKCRNRIAMWGGGVNAQHTLVTGSVEDVEREVQEVTACLKEDGGYVYNGIHNILAETTPEKVLAMYRAALHG